MQNSKGCAESLVIVPAMGGGGLFIFKKKSVTTT